MAAYKNIQKSAINFRKTVFYLVVQLFLVLYTVRLVINIFGKSIKFCAESLN